MLSPTPASGNDGADGGADRPNRVPWPPLIYAAVLTIAALLERYVPGLPAWPENFALRWLGAAMFIAGIGVAVAGLMRFRTDDTTFDPTGAARNLATEGIYARTRNPMYLGALVGFVGLALALRSPWLMLLVPGTALALLSLAILPEEAYLERRFGQAYRDYKSRVGRWL